MQLTLTEEDSYLILDCLRKRAASLRKEIQACSTPAQQYKRYIAQGLLKDTTRVKCKVAKQLPLSQGESEK